MMKWSDTNSCVVLAADLDGGVAKEGRVGEGGIYGPGFSYENGVRPAFCLKGDIRIQKQGEFYVLVLE